MPLTTSILRRKSSVLMKEGAKVEEEFRELLESLRCWRVPTLEDGAKLAAMEATELLRLWEDEVVPPASGKEGNMADLGRLATPGPLGPAEGEPPRTKGFRRMDMVNGGGRGRQCRGRSVCRRVSGYLLR
jgi:hypothetical protein